MSRDFSLADVRRLVLLAREAGEIILRIRAEHGIGKADWRQREKVDGSPVTHADEAAEAHILEGLHTLGLGAPVVAEESASNPDMSMAQGFYLIDPLDGTKAFTEGRSDFSVNIGYVAAGLPVMGVLHMPVAGDTYYTDGKAAYHLNPVNIEKEIRARVAAVDGVDVIVNRTEDWSGRLKQYLAGKNVRRMEQQSSAHKLALIATGEYDLYPRFGPTREWDIAAGHAILSAAGGSVTTLDGKDLGYGKPEFANPFFVAMGRLA
jgi:3'(2'), 5'-bisphosphate nucleotidase